jgi:hypothetical protein
MTVCTVFNFVKCAQPRPVPWTPPPAASRDADIAVSCRGISASKRLVIAHQSVQEISRISAPLLTLSWNYELGKRNGNRIPEILGAVRWISLRGTPMFKKLSAKLFKKDAPQPASNGFFLNVRCAGCGEQFKLFINKSWDLMQNFQENGAVTYSLKKEIIGVGCKNRILVSMQFDGGKKMLSKEIENGEFIEE